MIMAAKEDERRVVIPKLNSKEYRLGIKSTSQLILHRFSDKSKQQMLQKQIKTAGIGREAKDPIADFVNALHLFEEEDGIRQKLYERLHKASVVPPCDVTKFFKGVGFGFPADGFKKAAVDACRNTDLPMTVARGAFFILEDDHNGLVEIKARRVIIREDVVRLQRNTADIRFRGGLDEWTAKLRIRLNPDVLSPEQVVSLVHLSGFAVGVGDWRPAKSGSYGMFEVSMDNK